MFNMLLTLVFISMPAMVAVSICNICY